MKLLKSIIILLAGFVIASCGYVKSPEQRAMEKMLSKNYESVSVFDFEEYETITLCDEVEQKIKVFQWKLNWDKSFCNAYTDKEDDPIISIYPTDYILAKKAFYENEIVKDNNMLVWLNCIDEIYPELYNEVSFITYKISYLGTDKDGNKTHTNCYGRFNRSGDMVAFKLTIDSNWNLLGEQVSIPNYRDFI